MPTHSTKRTFSRSLEASVAVDDLSKELYRQRCRFVGIPEEAWSQVPYHVRAGLNELALRILRGLGEPAQPDAGVDTLFQLASDLARAEARRSNIIGKISPTEPWGVEAS